MPKREIAGIILGPLVLAAIILLPAWVFLILLGIVTLLAAWELLRMAAASGVACARIVPLVLLALLLGGAWWRGLTAAAVVAIAVMVVVPLIQLLHPERPSGSLSGVAVASFAVLFIGLTAACMGWILLWPGERLGAQLLVFFLVATWVGDSGAYYIGKNLGRHRMAPRISPKKTWEGLVAGIVTTLLAAAVMKLLFLELAWVHTIALALVLAVTGPLGDLVESQLKRDTGVKDSSALIPGHGGLLDRTDSLFFAAPPALAYLWLVGVV
jgi:phosphatidate cytidylyltransferase